MGRRIGKIYIGNSQVAPLLVSYGERVPVTGFLVRVIDYDGTVLKSERLNEGATFTLPSQPSHTGLVFQAWSSPVTITDNTVTVANSDITIGATYTTASGLSEFDITLTVPTGLTVTLNMDGTKDWGDGTSDTSTSHTYANVGDYTITCDGSTMTTSSSSGLFGQSSSAINYYVKDVRLGSSVISIGAYAFRNCYSLTSITIPGSVTNISNYAFYDCYSLTSITIPSSVTSISNYAFAYCCSLTSITIPGSVTNISNRAFYFCNSLTSVTIPSSVTSVGESAFTFCYSLTSVTIPGSVTSIGTYAFQVCYSLMNAEILEGATSIGSSMFSSCYSLTSVTIPSSVTSIGTSAFSGCSSLASVEIPNGVTSISNSAFSGCSSVVEYDFSNHSVVPTLSNINAFTGMNTECRIYVPWDLYSSWKGATNWSTYSDHIAVKNPATLNFAVTPANSIIYVNGSQIQGTSTSWVGSTASYVVHDSTNNVVLSGTQTGITEGSTINITADLTTSSKITLSTGITGLTAKVTVGGVAFDATDEGSGNYSINVVGSGTEVSYSISGDGYATATGTITTTGSNITEEVTMEPVTDQPWTRPNLSANGTMGGDEFAVSAEVNTAQTRYHPWHAVNGNTGSSYQWWSPTGASDKEYYFYNPNPLKVETLDMYCRSATARPATASVYGSNDNSTWTLISSDYTYIGQVTYLSNRVYRGQLVVNSSNFYSYHKIVMYPQNGSDVCMRELVITATQLA